MSASLVYWILIIGNIKTLLVMIIVGLVGWIIITMCYYAQLEENSDDEKLADDLFKKWLKKIIIVAIISSFIILFLTFCPSTNQMATIYLVPRLSQAKLTKKLPGYAAKLINLEIKRLEKENN